LWLSPRLRPEGGLPAPARLGHSAHMHDPVPVALALFVFLVAGAILWGTLRARRPPTPVDEVIAREPTCIICGPRNPTAATEPRIIIRSDEGFWAWVRSKLGAPARYVIDRARLRTASFPFDGEEPAYCVPHLAVALAEAHAELAGVEHRRRKAVKDEEVRLARFELVGINEQVLEAVGEHDVARRKGRAPAPTQLRPVPKKAAGDDEVSS